jgi:glycosyltransferase involved in cell wall biosynthesis
MKDRLLETASDLGISEKFTFTGRIPYEQVPFYISAADVCVAPFIKERNSKIGLSALKTYEYLACGKPIVASSIPGVQDLIESSGGGISVAPEDPEELAAAIVRLLSNKEIRDSMGKKGRRYVVENHSWDGVSRKILEICKDII